MLIRHYKHDAETTRELFGLLGEHLLSSRVHTAIGAKITSAIGDLWFVALDGNVVKGFCKLTPSKKPKEINLRAFYAFGDEAVEKALLQATATHARTMGAETIEAIEIAEKAPLFTSIGWHDRAASGLTYRRYACDLTSNKKAA